VPLLPVYLAIDALSPDDPAILLCLIQRQSPSDYEGCDAEAGSGFLIRDTEKMCESRDGVFPTEMAHELTGDENLVKHVIHDFNALLRGKAF
jgi:hypothetical protein